jgi:hypothetical protein
MFSRLDFSTCGDVAMETREIVLAGLLGSTVALWYGHMALVSNVFEPLAARRKELVDLQIERSQQQSVKTRQLRAAKQLGDWSKRGLPADPSTALALYHNWLIEWATKQGLTDVVVTPGRVDPKPKDKTYYVIPMTVKAKGRLETAVKALHEFHAAGMLQRVRNLAAASPAREGDPDLDLTMQVEALSLVDAPPRTTVVAGDAPTGPVLPMEPVANYGVITSQNPFVRGYNGPPPPAVTPQPPVVARPPTPPPSDGFDALAHIYLVAAIDKGGERMAWLYDRAGNTQTVLSVGQTFRVEKADATVTEIGRDYLAFRLGEKTLRLELGHPLRDVVVRTEPAQATPAAQ